MHSRALPSRAALALIAAGAMAIPLLSAPATPAGAQVSAGFTVSFDYFQDRLSRYGTWLHHPRWGDVWLPRSGPDFRPYYDGHWENTSDVGWLWLSDDPWGEITDHYGRWVFDPQYGWMWVPGYVWGPSWVVWRQGNGYVGWFPMPPDYDNFDPHYYGPSYGADAWYGYRAWHPGFSDTSFYALWVFTDERDFGFNGPRRYIVDPSRIRDVYRRSAERTHYVDDHNRIVDRSIDVGRLEQDTHRHFDEQPARRFLANIPTTSVTEGRDIARRYRNAFGGAGPNNFGGGRGQDQARPAGNGQGQGFAPGFPGNDRRNDAGPNRGNAPQGFAVPDKDNRGNPADRFPGNGNGAPGRAPTNNPAPQANVQTGPAQSPGAVRGGNPPRDRDAGQGRGPRGGGQVQGPLQTGGNNIASQPVPQPQAAAPPVRPPPPANAPARSGQNATDDRRQRGRGQDANP